MATLTDELNAAGRRSGGKRGPRKPPSPTAKLLNLPQASTEFGLPYTTLRDLVLTGQLPAVRFGDARRVWVRRTDLETLIERSVEKGVA